MNRYLTFKNIDKKYIHKLSETAFFKKLDKLTSSAVLSYSENSKEKFFTDVNAAFAIGIVNANSKILEEDSVFHTCLDKWVFGDYIVSPGSWFKTAPYEKGAEVVVAAMNMSHDPVCDIEPMMKVFLEGGLSGDIDNLCIIMVYDQKESTLMRKLEALGVMFLYDDTGASTDDDFEPYFPIRSIHPYHENDTHGRFRVDLTIPLPVLSEFNEDEIVAAAKLQEIYARFPELRDSLLVRPNLIEELEMLEKGFLFSEDVLSSDEINEQRGFRRNKDIELRKERTLTKESQTEFLEENQQSIKDCKLQDSKKNALIDVLEYAVPLADFGAMVLPRYILNDYVKPFDVWAETICEYPIEIKAVFPYSLYLFAPEERDNFAKQIQGLGRLMGIEEKLSVEKESINK